MFFLKISGIFSSLILIIAGIQISSIEGLYLNLLTEKKTIERTDSKLLLEQKIREEAFFNYMGTALIGLGCFTGPLLFGVASLIDKEKRQEANHHWEEQQEKRVEV